MCMSRKDRKIKTAKTAKVYLDVLFAVCMVFCQKFLLRMVSVLFVCLGNICRSPLAEAIFNYQVRQKQLQPYFRAASCGTANYHIGDPPDSRTIRNAIKNGITIQHIGRQFDTTDFKEFDLIVPMDESNRDNLLQLRGAEKFRDKIKLMRSFDTENRGGDVPDPYSGSEKNFQEVFEILDRSVRGLLQVLVADLK